MLYYIDLKWSRFGYLFSYANCLRMNLKKRRITKPSLWRLPTGLFGEYGRAMPFWNKNSQEKLSHHPLANQHTALPHNA